MGFFKNLAKQMFMTKIGIVTGSDFAGGELAMAHKDGVQGLGIVRKGQEDYIFIKSDIAEFSKFETDIKFFIGSDPKIGNKYRVVFKDGKSAILCIPAAQCSIIENLFY